MNCLHELGLTGESCLESMLVMEDNIVSILLPFLYISVTRAVVQACGSLPVVYDCWNMC